MLLANLVYNCAVNYRFKVVYFLQAKNVNK